MSKFRKKPVVIEAWQHKVSDDGKTVDRDYPAWLLPHIDAERVGGGFSIKTLEGTMFASPNDWIIQGVKGELYPCKPDIFTATYEPVEP